MYCNSNTSGYGIFSHHTVLLEKDKTIDIATMNVSIDHQKKGSRLMIVTVKKRRGNSLILERLLFFSLPLSLSLVLIHSFTQTSAQF
jgi:hypothetical protein